MAGRNYMGIPRDRIPWEPKIDPVKCIGCGACMEACPNGVYVLDEAAGKMEVVEPVNCVVLCDKCATFCPEEAVSFPDKQATKDLLKRILEEAAARKKNGKE